MAHRWILWIGLLALAGCGGGGGPAPAGNPAPLPMPPFVTEATRFVEVTAAAGMADPGAFDTQIDYRGEQGTGRPMVGGACAGDFDGDGWLDVYLVRGASGRNRLYRNQRDGTFVDVAAAAGVDVEAVDTGGPTFVDYDGDGLLDLFLCGVNRKPSRLFRNRGDGTFEDVTAAAGLVFQRGNTMSAAFGDYDGDGDLDLYTAHWEYDTILGSLEHLWRNRGDGTFEDVSALAGLTALYAGTVDYSFCPNFVDIDSDGRLDVLLVSDYGGTRILHNRGDGTFADTTNAVISDKNGMGSAIGDYDNDGDLDWFVSAIKRDGTPTPPGSDPTTLEGNRLYRNHGDGTFEDVTDVAGVRDGAWGWGSVFADFNNDCWLDLFHTNGWFGTRFIADESRLFISRGDGTFDQVASAAGIVEQDQGRGVVAFDFDRDGDIDLLQANLNEPPRLWRNDTPRTLHHLAVILRGVAPNTQAVGARVFASIGGLTQMRELRCGNNYVSANAVEAHFGLGPATTVDVVRVEWPDGERTILRDVAADQLLTIPHPSR